MPVMGMESFTVKGIPSRGFREMTSFASSDPASASLTSRSTSFDSFIASLNRSSTSAFKSGFTREIRFLTARSKSLDLSWPFLILETRTVTGRRSRSLVTGGITNLRDGQKSPINHAMPIMMILTPLKNV